MMATQQRYMVMRQSAQTRDVAFFKLPT